MNNPHHGSSLEDLLSEEGILEEATIEAQKRIREWLRKSPWSGKKEVFVHESVSDDEIETLFGPFSPGEREAIVRFDGVLNLEEVSVAMGKFKSKTQARKNGWTGEVQPGYIEHKVGKTRFWTYTPL